MKLFQSISSELFLANYWQKTPYVFRQSMVDIVDLVDGDELAGLACEETVEARIIRGYQHHSQKEQAVPWQYQQGPFDEQAFSLLGEKNWTLLVQGIDQWLDEARDILSCFDFLPQWRLEDIMASYAPIGGGVGPHFDYYDVFLIQVSGSRQWRLGQMCDENTPLQDHSQVKLLEQFVTDEVHELQAGDVIYIPAGKAHWGTATSDDCITFSVGFRAPSEKEMLMAVLDKLAEKLTLTTSDNRRYRDEPQLFDEHPAKINHSVHQQLSQSLNALTALDFQTAINESFGQLVTEPRYGSDEESECADLSLTKDDLNRLLHDKGEIVLFHPSYSRLAFSDTCLFVNGHTYMASEVFSRAICDALVVDSMSDHEASLLLELIQQKDIMLDNSE